MRRALVRGVAGTEVGAVIRGAGEHGVVLDAQAAQGVAQPPHPLVHAFDLPRIAADVAVRTALRRGRAERGEVRREPPALVPLPVPGGGRVVVRRVLVVLFEQGEEEQERPFVVVGDEPDRRVDEGVRAVAREAHRLALAVEHHRAVGVRGELQPVRGQPVVVTAAPLGRHGPVGPVLAGQVSLADVARRPARRAEDRGERGRVGRQGGRCGRPRWGSASGRSAAPNGRARRPGRG